MSFRLIFDENGVSSVGVIRDGADAAETRRRHDFLQRIAVPLAFLDSEIKRIEKEFCETNPEYDRLQKEREDEIEFYWLDFFRAHDDLKFMANRDILQAALDRENLAATPENLELVSRIEEAKRALAKRR